MSSFQIYLDVPVKGACSVNKLEKGWVTWGESNVTVKQVPVEKKGGRIHSFPNLILIKKVVDFGTGKLVGPEEIVSRDQICRKVYILFS